MYVTVAAIASGLELLTYSATSPPSFVNAPASTRSAIWSFANMNTSAALAGSCNTVSFASDSEHVT